jgi:hypothetical protein
MSEKYKENEIIKSWNIGPINLSKRNMLLPNQVLEEFFKIYSLPEIRSLLKVIFHHASNSSNLSAEQLYLLQQQLIKLIEASSLLNTTADKYNVG